MASLSNAAPDIDHATTASAAAAAMMSNGSPQHDNTSTAHASSTAANDQLQQQQQSGQIVLSQASQHSSSSLPQQTRSVKRPRPVKSCTECRKRKLKCDRSCPCAQCTKSHRTCKYATDQDAAALSDGSDGEMTETGRPLKKPCFSTLGGDRRIEGVTTGSGNTISNGTGMHAAPSSLEPTITPVRNGEPPPPSSLTLEEVAVRLERLENMVKSRPPERGEASVSKSWRLLLPSNTIRQLSVKDGARRTRFFGQNSTKVLIDLFPDAKHYLRHHDNIEGLGDTIRKLGALRKMLQAEYRKSVTPISVFADSMVPVEKRMTDILPSKATSDQLLSAYINTNETLYRLIHIPTFTEMYDRYWEGTLQSDSFLPQLLAVLAIGTRFVAKSKGLGHDRMEGVHIPTACALIRTWLNGLRGKQLVQFTSLQTEVLLQHAHRVMSLERAQETWSQLGKIVRMAQCMGLHRDPSEFEDISVFHGELRRRLWFTILDMDLHVSLVNNLPCVVREGDFTCLPPRNLDDKDLFEEMTELPPGKPIEQTTECQIQVYASTTFHVRLKAANMVNRIDSISDYQEVLDIGQRLDRYIEDINYVFPRHGLTNHHEKSRQWRWRVIMDMHVRRPLLALYRPLALGALNAPREIVQTYLRSCMVILRYLDELDPTLPHYREVGDMYLQILKPDIIQSCFSVCFYIQNILRQSGGGLDPTLQAFPESMDQMSYASDTAMLGTPSRLISTVQKSISLLISNQGSGDLRDIVPLYLVFRSVQPSPPPLPQEDIVHGMRSLLEQCLQYTGTNEKMLKPYLTPPPARALDGPYVPSRPRYPTTTTATTTTTTGQTFQPHAVSVSGAEWTHGNEWWVE